MKAIDKFNNNMLRVINYFLVAGSIVMIVVNFLQVFFRIIRQSIPWSEEFSTYLYIWLIFFSLYEAALFSSELKIEVANFKNTTAAKIFFLIREFLSLLACAAFFYGSILLISNSLRYPQKTASLGTITAYFLFCMPVIFAFLCWVKSINIVKAVKNIDIRPPLA